MPLFDLMPDIVQQKALKQVEHSPYKRAGGIDFRGVQLTEG